MIVKLFEKMFQIATINMFGINLLSKASAFCLRISRNLDESKITVIGLTSSLEAESELQSP